MCFFISISFINLFLAGDILLKLVNKSVSDYFFLNSYLHKETKLKKTDEDDIELWEKINMWAISDVESNGEGGVVYRSPIWRTEEANELIRRCDLSINKTRCYIEASERGTSRVHRDIMSEEYLD